MRRTLNRHNLLLMHAAIAALLAAYNLGAVRAERFGLRPVVRGASALTQIRARELPLTGARPTGVKRIPKGLVAPYYTTIVLGPREKPSRFTVLVDAPEGAASRIWVDANGNGDLLDDPPAEWAHKTYAGRESDHLIASNGGATLQVRYGAVTVPTHVTLSRTDTSEPPRDPQFQPLMCTADYAREGEVSLGVKSYHVWLIDALSKGDFRGSGVAGQSGIFLLIDVNGNGRVDVRGESYEASEPFNIGGITYEIRGLDAGGSALEIVRSSRTAAEVVPPPDLAIGKIAPGFIALTTDGRMVHFPEDYRGRKVLLYFWATWCGDCRRETPFVTAAYKQFHPMGLEALGVSLDHADGAAVLAEYTREHQMDWPQIFDGKIWDAAIAQLYYVRHTPTPLLVDGDTGRILAAGSQLLGENLSVTIEKALKAR